MHATGERQVGTRLEEIRLDHRERYRWACERLPAGATVLDAGCGVGYGSALISAQAAAVVGLDAAADAVAFAQRHWANEKTRFEQQDLHFLHFPPETPPFDAVVCFECIEHLAVPELFLCRLRQYLKPGAPLFLSVPFETVRPFHPDLNPYHFMHYTLNDLQSLLQRTGFACVEVDSQDDDEVRPGLEGRFLICHAQMEAAAPALDLAALEKELPSRYAQQLVVLGNELALALGVRKTLERRDTEVADLRKHLQEARNATQEARNLLLQERNKDHGGQIKALREGLQGDLARLRQEVADLRRQQKDAQQQQKDAQQQQKDAQQQQKELQKQIQEARKQVRAVWEHPAIRRLARFNWFGLRLLSLFGIRLPGSGGRHKPAAREHSAPPSQPPAGQDGKEPAPAERLTAAHEVYVRGFASAAHVYGAQARVTSRYRIAVDISRLFDEHLTGVGHYCDQLTRALLRRSPHAIVLYSGKPLPDWVLNYTGYPSFVHCPPRRVVSNYAHTDKAPDLERFTGKIDAYIDASAAYAPIVRAKNRIAFIHDLAPISCPETVPEAVTTRCHENAQFLASNTAAFLANSEYTKQEFVKYAGIDPARVTVVPVGLDPVFQVPVTPEEVARVRARYQLDEPYLLCVGTLQPRKNLARLLEAYGQLCEANPDTPRLVLTGSDQWGALPEFGETLNRLHDAHRVEWIGYVDRGDMPALYQASTLFVYPSYFEGYGMPVAEAMASGAAVVCGNLTSLPEVAGDAAEYCDPFSVESIVAALRRVLDDPAHAEALRARSLEQARSYLSWDDVADAYLKVVDPVLNGQGS
jgi:alpha-1,3-rhamnosyl/mannosyltransferase